MEKICTPQKYKYESNPSTFNIFGRQTDCKVDPYFPLPQVGQLSVTDSRDAGIQTNIFSLGASWAPETK